MPYVVDGHNLIGNLPDLSLGDLDDEAELIGRLKLFARLRRKEVDVFFDGSPGPTRVSKRSGGVRAHFIRSGKTADEAIEEFLDGLRGAAQNWIVVSSDARVQRAAQRVHARPQSSQDFTAAMHSRVEAAENNEPLDPDDVEDWIQIFSGDKQ